MNQLLLVTLCSLGLSIQGAELAVKASDLPRVPATPPERAVATCAVRPGFHLEQMAAEPMVMSPVAFAFDEHARLFVIEMRDYSERRDERLGGVKLLEDTDGDGKFDKATLFAADLPWPTGITCWDGGVYVIASPDLLYLKDTDGDGKADIRRVMFTGFGNLAPKLNVQALANSLTWGLDNRIHGALGGNPSIITNLGRTDMRPLELRGKDFSFDPRTGDFRAESGGGQYGMAFDDVGRKFACSNSRHLMQIMYDERAASRSTHALPPAATDIAVDGAAAEVFRRSPDEPWRVIRTRWRVAGLATGPIEGGGRSSGYFTGATGVSIYRGDAWPEEFRGDVFIADCGSNLIHRKKLRESGVALRGERAADEQKIEFIASTDNWFRPVQMGNAPDGNLWFADMYREVIEHPWSLPPALKQLIDLNSGNDRGRIYRVVKDGYAAPTTNKWRAFTAKPSSKEMVALLEHPNGWHRDTAARLLYQRQDGEAWPLLVSLLNTSKFPTARLQALWTLKGLGRLADPEVRKAMGDLDENVRIGGLRVAREMYTRAPDEITRALAVRGADASPRVRYELDWTVGMLDLPGKDVPLLASAIRASDDWERQALLASLGGAAYRVTATMLTNGSMQHAFVRDLLRLNGTRNRTEEVTALMRQLEKSPDHIACRGYAALGEGMQRAGGTLAKADGEGRLRGRIEKELAAKGSPDRGEWIELAGFYGEASLGPVLKSLMVDGAAGESVAALKALARLRAPDFATGVISAWSKLSPEARAAAVGILSARAEDANALLKGVEQGTVNRRDLSPTDMAALRGHRDAGVRRRAEKLFPKPPPRDAVVAEYLPALDVKGDATRGREIFRQRCANCHRLQQEGAVLGPDLAAARSGGKEKLLVNILDPSREITVGFASVAIETKGDESLSGLIGSENAASVTLRVAGGTERVLPRTEIRSLTGMNQSLMPEGLEAGLTKEQFADLLEFVFTAK